MTTDVQTTPAMPRLNEPAPAFDAPTTHGRKTLEDYRGQWLVLFSHPADFTPVCTTEFIAFANRHADFQAIGCELIGLSIDSNFSHIAWERNIKEKFGVEISFPIIADLSMRTCSPCPRSARHRRQAFRSDRVNDPLLPHPDQRVPHAPRVPSRQGWRLPGPAQLSLADSDRL